KCFLVVYWAGVPTVTVNVSSINVVASGVVRKTRGGAISACLSARPRGVFLPKNGIFSCGWPFEGWMGVQIGPGATALTRMPLAANCWPIPLLKLLIAAFVEA